MGVNINYWFAPSKWKYKMECSLERLLKILFRVEHSLRKFFSLAGFRKEFEVGFFIIFSLTTRGELAFYWLFLKKELPIVFLEKKYFSFTFFRFFIVRLKYNTYSAIFDTSEKRLLHKKLPKYLCISVYF